MKKTYYVESLNENGYEIKTVAFETFDKPAIKAEFLSQCEALPEGGETAYFYSDAKYLQAAHFSVEKRKGEIQIQVVKGNKMFYKAFNPETFIKI